MDQLIVCQNKQEQIAIKWDGERFGVVSHSRLLRGRLSLHPKVIVLNPLEAEMVSKFIQQELKGAT